MIVKEDVRGRYWRTCLRKPYWQELVSATENGEQVYTHMPTLMSYQVRRALVKARFSRPLVGKVTLVSYGAAETARGKTAENNATLTMFWKRIMKSMVF